MWMLDKICQARGVFIPPVPPPPRHPKTTPRVNDSDFQSRLDRLHADIVAQGDRVLEQATLAFDAYFDHDQDLARQATAIESEVDRVDVEIERRSIPLLALGQTDEYAIRSVLTIVKINNEFERIGDNANAIAEATLDPRRVGSSLPDTFRVMEIGRAHV